MLKKIKIKGTKINDFSTLNEIEKYLLEIFGDRLLGNIWEKCDKEF